MVWLQELDQFLNKVKARGAVSVSIDDGGLTLLACDGDDEVVGTLEVGGFPVRADEP